jgi:hypothetical protein
MNPHPTPKKVWLEFNEHAVRHLASWLVQQYNATSDCIEDEKEDANDTGYIEWQEYNLAMIGILLEPVRRTLGAEFEAIARVECTWPNAEGAPPTLHERRLLEVLEVSSGVPP